jgi:hypothetical protein
MLWERIITKSVYDTLAIYNRDMLFNILQHSPNISSDHEVLHICCRHE